MYMFTPPPIDPIWWPFPTLAHCPFAFASGFPCLLLVVPCAFPRLLLVKNLIKKASQPAQSQAGSFALGFVFRM